VVAKKREKQHFDAQRQQKHLYIHSFYYLYRARGYEELIKPKQKRAL